VRYQAALRPDQDYGRMEGWNTGILSLRKISLFFTPPSIIPPFHNSIIPLCIYYIQFPSKSPVPCQTTFNVP